MPGGARRRANPPLQRGGQPHSKPRKPRGGGRRFAIRRLSSPARADTRRLGQARQHLAGGRPPGLRDYSQTNAIGASCVMHMHVRKVIREEGVSSIP